MRNYDQSIIDVINEEILKPDLEMICPPLIEQGTATMVYAPTAVGKTYFALSIAFAVVEGVLWNGEQTRKSSVIYFDGEFGSQKLTDRFPSGKVFTKDPYSNFKLHCHNHFHSSRIPNPADPRNFDYYKDFCKDSDLIVFDNYNSIVRPAEPRQSDIETWDSFLNLILEFKKMNKGVLIVHHTNKTGEQYGTVFKTNTMDNNIRLMKFYKQEEGKIFFEIKLEKSRHKFMQGKEEFGMILHLNEEGWITEPVDLDAIRLEHIEALAETGWYSSLEIAQILHVSDWTVNRIVKKRKTKKGALKW
jgi:hypothetical protein